MTDRELMQQALEAMGTVGADWICEASHHAKKDQHKWGEPCPLQQRWHIAYQALRERLAQPEPAPGYCKHCKQYTIEEPLRTHWEGCEEVHPECRQPEQEPVAWISEGGDVSRSKRYMDEMGFECNPLYAAPQRRDWVGLTVKEIVITAEACGGLASDFVVDVARAIEAKLKEKNT